MRAPTPKSHAKCCQNCPPDLTTVQHSHTSLAISGVVGRFDAMLMKMRDEPLLPSSSHCFSNAHLPCLNCHNGSGVGKFGNSLGHGRKGEGWLGW